MTTTRRATGLLAAFVALTGCGGGTTEETAPTVTVQAGAQEVAVDPTQYCLSGDGQRYGVSAPVIEVPADTPIVLQVPDVLADDGWSVQVFDQDLAEVIGEVDVGPDTPVFDGINSSDVAPAGFYLVVVQRRDPDACAGLSGAWPIGFIRSGGGTSSTAPTTSPSG
ncbi:MAG: uncharacterized protein JWR62_3512 [Modestobacter sp.]|nr:uncharacterized protein [Modestobacter sp.]